MLDEQFIRRKEKALTSPGQIPEIAPSDDHTDGTWSPQHLHNREICINTADKKMWVRMGDDIVEITAGDAFVLAGNLPLSQEYIVQSEVEAGGELEITLDNTIKQLVFVVHDGLHLMRAGEIQDSYVRFTVDLNKVYVSNLHYSIRPGTKFVVLYYPGIEYQEPPAETGEISLSSISLSESNGTVTATVTINSTYPTESRNIILYQQLYDTGNGQSFSGEATTKQVSVAPDGDTVFTKEYYNVPAGEYQYRLTGDLTGNEDITIEEPPESIIVYGDFNVLDLGSYFGQQAICNEGDAAENGVYVEFKLYKFFDPSWTLLQTLRSQTKTVGAHRCVGFVSSRGFEISGSDGQYKMESWYKDVEMIDEQTFIIGTSGPVIRNYQSAVQVQKDMVTQTITWAFTNKLRAGLNMYSTGYRADGVVRSWVKFDTSDLSGVASAKLVLENIQTNYLDSVSARTDVHPATTNFNLSDAGSYGLENIWDVYFDTGTTWANSITYSDATDIIEINLTAGALSVINTENSILIGIKLDATGEEDGGNWQQMGGVIPHLELTY